MHKLLQHPDLWQASQQNALPSMGQAKHALSTGYKVLDNNLHSHGWPNACYTEMLYSQHGISELQLLIPALRDINQQAQLALINPPFQPYGPALAAQGLDLESILLIQSNNNDDALWSNEQLLRSGHFFAVLHWFDKKPISYPQQRKLQLAAQEGHSWAIAFRDEQFAQQSSAAKLRLHLQANAKQLQIDVLKQPGGWAGQQVQLPRKQLQQHKPPVDWPQANNYLAAKRQRQTSIINVNNELRVANNNATQT